MQRPRFGATKATPSSAGTSTFSLLLEQLPQPLSESLLRAQAKAQSLGNRELHPLHLLYGMFELAQAQLESKPLPFNKGKSEARPYQSIVDALLPPDKCTTIPPENLAVGLGEMCTVMDSYLVDTEYFSKPSKHPSKQPATLNPVFTAVLETVAKAENPVDALLHIMKMNPTDILAEYPHIRYDETQILSSGFEKAHTMLDVVTNTMNAPELAISPPVSKVEKPAKSGAIDAILAERKATKAKASSASTTEAPITKKAMLELLEARSPILAAAWIQAEHIARNANSPTIELKHITLALLRHAVEIQKKLPEFTSASPDEVPNELQVDTFIKYFPRLARTMLDNLLPLELRQGLTDAQLQTMLVETEHAVDQLVYTKGRRLVENVKNGLEPKPSLALREVLARVNDAANKDNSLFGYYSYAFAGEMKTLLDKATDGDHARLGEILNKLHTQAKDKSVMIPNVTFDDIGGYDDVKAEFEEFIDMNLHPEEYLKEGITPEQINHGAIMYGPPGTGKTHFAKAIANKMGLPFFSVNGADFVRKYVGTGAENVGKLFAEARKHGKALIFIDEIDALLGRRSGGSDGGSNERDNTVNAVLSELDGIAKDHGVIVIGATNRLDRIDEAALRPGRLGKHIQIENPDKDARLAILKIHTKKMNLGPDVDLPKIARLTRGSSSVDMRNLATEAAMFALEEVKANRRNKPGIIQTDFDEAFDRIQMGPKRLKAYPEFDTKVVANHEVLGHGLFAYALDRQLRTVSTIGRRDSAGHVYHLPAEGEEGFASDTLRSNLQNLLIKLAGRAAEDVTMGRDNITGGARGDFQSARQLLVSMMNDGHMTGYQATSYEGKAQCSGKDEALVTFLLNRGMDVAKDMVSVIDEAQRKKMEKQCLKRIELRWNEATNFYKKHVTPEQKAQIKALADGFVQEVLDTLDSKVQEQIAEFKKPAKADSSNPFSSERLPALAGNG